MEAELVNAQGRRLHGHTGAVAAVVAAVGFATGSYGAYRVLDKPAAAQILLRQAIEPERMAAYDGVPGSGGVLVLLRNDSTMPVEVIDSAFARTSAAPPLYIAPESVPPGGEVNVYVAVAGKCSASNTSVAGTDSNPVLIWVNVLVNGGPVRSVPVQVTGELALIAAKCGLAAGETTR